MRYRARAAILVSTLLAALGGGRFLTNAQVSLGETLYFPQFANGADAGESGFVSEILLSNTGAASATAEITLRGDDGTPAAVNLNGSSTAGTLRTTIPANGLRVFR